MFSGRGLFWVNVEFFETFRYVTDATVAVFVAVLLFVLPSQPPQLKRWLSCFNTGDFTVSLSTYNTTGLLTLRICNMSITKTIYIQNWYTLYTSINL